jgi:hypothetical protein
MLNIVAIILYGMFSKYLYTIFANVDTEVNTKLHSILIALWGTNIDVNNYCLILIYFIFLDVILLFV